MPKILSSVDVLQFRQRLCDIALSTFAEHGVEGLSLRNLAAAAGCSRSTPYRYFKNKADILAAVRESAFRRTADSMEAVAESVDDPVERLEALAKAYLEHALERPDAYRVMHAVSHQDEQQYPELLKQIKRSQRPMLQAVNDAIDAGSVEGDAINIAHILWAGLHGIVSLHLSDKLHMGRDIEELGAVMIRTLGRAIAVSPSGEPATQRIMEV